MSKVVMSLPKGMVKNSVVGGLLALAVYVAMQFFYALLIHRGAVGMERLYPMTCAAALLASFLGCGYSVVRGKGTSMLTVPVVVAVFLTLTLAAAFFTADAICVDNGLTGIGLSMAAGGAGGVQSAPRGREPGEADPPEAAGLRCLAALPRCRASVKR